ncbi:SOUL haem-binding protein [Kipferlia bialata]|uniref:SOUL haem-binding protein n=1 Tax=Kipferlia bialata TaxID=797122 RepID=A0A9K3CWZ3_9EUKA|nr:SOUL haem-binding protein [Kipferlia bialata]GIQ82548.1 SOUL haem-binding protein [Kipferlia bialata]GIQ84828.1 SOUL haem-binding protein [Kipferlia bialata]|eukprot:g77.t1
MVKETVYQVKSKKKGYEIRHYPPHVIARVTVDADFEGVGNKGFRTLFNYISGANTGSTRIPMTTPVNMSESKPKGKHIAMTAPVNMSRGTGAGTFNLDFAIPSKYTLETVPKPTDSRVKLILEPECDMAALRYKGGWGQSNYAKHEQRLMEALERDHVNTLGEPIYARYTCWP